METIWPAKPKIFTICTLTEKVCTPLKLSGILQFQHSLLYLLVLQTINSHKIYVSIIYQVLGIILVARAKSENKTDIDVELTSYNADLVHACGGVRIAQAITQLEPFHHRTSWFVGSVFRSNRQVNSDLIQPKFIFLEGQVAAVCPFPHMSGSHVSLLTSGGKDNIFSGKKFRLHQILFLSQISSFCV